MSFRTVNGAAKTSDTDYVVKTGTLTFAPGETTKTITISVNLAASSAGSRVSHVGCANCTFRTASRGTPHGCPCFRAGRRELCAAWSLPANWLESTGRRHPAATKQLTEGLFMRETFSQRSGEVGRLAPSAAPQ